MFMMTLAFGVVFIGVGVYFAVRWFRRRNWISFRGEVVRVRESFGIESDGVLYYPTIRVECQGDNYDFESDLGSYPAPKVGQRRSVIGDPRTKQFSEFGVWVAILTVFLPIVLGVGVAALGWSTYQQNKNVEQDVDGNPLAAP